MSNTGYCRSGDDPTLHAGPACSHHASHRSAGQIISVLIPEELSIGGNAEDDPVTGWDDLPEILPSTADRQRARPRRLARRVSVMAATKHLPVALHGADDAPPA